MQARDNFTQFILIFCTSMNLSRDTASGLVRFVSCSLQKWKMHNKYTWVCTLNWWNSVVAFNIDMRIINVWLGVCLRLLSALFTKSKYQISLSFILIFCLFFQRCFRRVESFQSLHKVRLFHVVALVKWASLFICDVFVLLKFSISNTPHKTVTHFSYRCASANAVTSTCHTFGVTKHRFSWLHWISEHSFPSPNGDTADVLRLF